MTVNDLIMKKVLITGMSGLIGGVVRRQLDGKCELSALNRRRVEGVECYQADISDFNAILPAFKDKDVVVHLAAVAAEDAPWEDHLHYNVAGTYNVFEASRRAGISRLIFASSGSTVSGWERSFPYKAIAEGRYSEVSTNWEKLTHQSPTRPTGVYGCTKIWGEALARHYSDAYGISTICLRIGAVNLEDRPLEPRHFSIWCSQRDVASMIEKCIEAPESLKFDIFYVVSNNNWNYRDLEHAREVVGFKPQDTADRYR
ncbi:MAG: NAD-dependent epimerase/dehydratase family protein [Candidatus Bathyarchaeia archaeon]